MSTEKAQSSQLQNLLYCLYIKFKHSSKTFKLHNLKRMYLHSHILIFAVVLRRHHTSQGRRPKQARSIVALFTSAARWIMTSQIVLPAKNHNEAIHDDTRCSANQRQENGINSKLLDLGTPSYRACQGLPDGDKMLINKAIFWVLCS